MSIKPLQKEKLVPDVRPLPPCWLRKRETHLRFTENISRDIWQVGPGKRLHSRMIELINGAQEVICGATFLLSDQAIAEALLAATERGVRVYFLTASEHRVKVAPRSDDFFTEKLCEEHKALLDRLAGKVLLRSAEHFHAKFLLCDPRRSSPRGIMTTANFNPALSESVELGIELSSAEARELAGWFNRAFWLEAEHELLEKGKLSAVAEPAAEPAIPEQEAVVVTTGKQATLQQEILRIIRNSRNTLLVASYGFEAGHAVVNAIAEAARKGVKVTIFTRPRPAVKEALAQLAEAGAHIVAHDKLHAKAVIGDHEGVVMTANLQSDGMNQGFEVGIILFQQRLRDLRRTLEEWRKEFPWHYAAKALPQEHVGEIWLADKGIKDGKREVVAELTHKLSPIFGRDALTLGDTPEPTFAMPNWRDKYPQAVRFQWEIKPPTLPRGAIERKQKIEQEQMDKKGQISKVKEKKPCDPPEYELNGEVFVVLKPGGNVEKVEKRARELAAKVVLP